VFESADSIVVLRQGRRVATLDADKTDGNEVVALMTGLRST
jgi:ABC-type sugar transport system ATPase subunit